MTPIASLTYAHFLKKKKKKARGSFIKSDIFKHLIDLPCENNIIYYYKTIATSFGSPFVHVTNTVPQSKNALPSHQTQVHSQVYPPNKSLLYQMQAVTFFLHQLITAKWPANYHLLWNASNLTFDCIYSHTPQIATQNSLTPSLSSWPFLVKLFARECISLVGS